MGDITSQEVIKDLKKLGNQNTEYPIEPNINILETFKAPSLKLFTVKFVQEHNEFSSICPKSHQPDFATIKILYSPSNVCIESKSLKLYLFSYRNSKGFGEHITNKIADDLQAVLNSRWLVVIGDFSPRGGLRWVSKVIRNSVDVCDLFDYEKLMIAEFN
jgi:7-cyano-7-deazaguanine reductase